ncbi:uncharacterized protein LOC119601530 [Lucilia sericata]|uniref:uncharacterized protein LOC119601530 n=1 Tax=Lucilia sericata TaxID=13632 RepID=UPI0018A85789|nr:uncharacterized protein LOC119601530 [Lucilia sericata]
MTLRACIYKNCANYINLRDRSINKDIKLFSFPKNPERRQKWMELGKVPPNQPASMYYFCSDHFDKKYLAINNVRTVLVGDAVPFPYVEPEVDETYEDSGSNLDYFLYELNKEDGDNTERQQDEQDLQVESTTMLNELQESLHDEHFSINLENEETDECIVYTDEEKDTQQIVLANNRKRKLYNTILQAQASSSNAKIIKTSILQKPLRKSPEKQLHAKSPQPSTAAKSASTSLSQTQESATVVSEETTKEEIDVNDLIDGEHVTTFIFKGEEYVQMPKEHYINEKLELMKKLRKMESTIKTIKEHLNLLDV